MNQTLATRPFPDRFQREQSSPFDRERLDPKIERFAHWLDSQFAIPGTNIRFGLDAILGLFPALGDLLPSLASLYILFAAQRYGVSRATLARMALNIAFDYVAGSVPVAGDVFDLFWKSNDRNAAFLAKHVNANPQQERNARRQDRWFVAAVAAGLVVLLGASIAASWFVIYSLAKLLVG